MRSNRLAPRSSVCSSRLRLSCCPPVRCKGGEDASRIRDPSEDPALGLDHSQPDFVKFGEVRSAAVLRDDAAIAAIVRLTHRRVDANLGGDAADDQVLDATIGE